VMMMAIVGLLLALLMRHARLGGVGR
jgi:hypothetical protein